MWQDYVDKYKDKKIKLIVAGSRDFAGRDLYYKWLDFLLKNTDNSDIVILDGGATGPDSFGGDYGRLNSIDVWDFPSDWKNLDVVPYKIKTNKFGKYNCLAGLNRNKDMGDNATHLVAFNLNTSGTNDMLAYSTKLVLIIKEIKLYKAEQ